jgi:hypothetical protein
VAAAALRRTIGSLTVKVVPFPGVDSTAIRPLCSSTSCLAIARPRPAPPESRVRASSARKKRSKMRSTTSSSMPIPVSETRIVAHSPERLALVDTDPPGSV